MRIACHLAISVLSIFLTANAALSRDIKVNFNFSDIADGATVEVVLFLEIATDLINRDTTSQKRLDGRTDRSNRVITAPRVTLPNNSNEIMVHGFITVSGKRAFFPIIRKVVPEGSTIVEFSAEEMQPRSDYLLASKEGFPFRSGSNYQLPQTDIPSVINSAEIFVRRSEFLELKIPDELWTSLYNLFSANAANIASNSAENLPRLTSLLAAYASRSTERAFVGFYSDFLNNLVLGKIGGVNVAGVPGEEFVFDQQKNIFEKSPLRSLPSLNNSLTAYLKTRNFERCVQLAEFSFAKLSQDIEVNPSIYRGLGTRLLAQSIYNSMITSTNCVQSIYVLDGNGSKNSPEGASKFAGERDWGSLYMESFVLLNDVSRDRLQLNIDAQASIQSFVIWFRSNISNQT